MSSHSVGVAFPRGGGSYHRVLVRTLRSISPKSFSRARDDLGDDVRVLNEEQRTLPCRGSSRSYCTIDHCAYLEHTGAARARIFRRRDYIR